MIIPNKIIFLDIDGVLNSNKYFSSREYYYKEHKKIEYTLEDTIKRQLYDIDMNKLELLLKVVKITTTKIVITSSWRRLSIYPYIKKYGHFLIGYKCDNKGNIKYIVYGIPGKKDKDEQPYVGKTGFITWMSEKDKDVGYWLMFYDYKKSMIVVPMK